MKHILILGGSYAGVSTTHRLLKQASKVEPFKITIVSPNTHFYWNIAAPRAIIPGKIADTTISHPVEEGFSQYSTDVFEFVLGTALSLDVEGQSVEILSKARGKRTISYDFLILATGSRTTEVTPFKMVDSTEETLEVLHDFQKKVADAKTIVIAGAGFTGCETVGELGHAYGKEKNIVLVSHKHIFATLTC
jgi:NADH dehydrogenase FAD-containing subunit